MADLLFPDCALCRRSLEPGWLCAKHPGMPWEHDDCKAEGAPCIFNPEGAVRWGKLIAEVVHKRTLQ